jgi:PEP-CTERM motif-containing protein
MKSHARMAIAAGALLGAFAVGTANAAVTIDTDFNTTATGVTPNTVDVASATSIGFFLLPISNIVTDNTGIILFGTLPVLTNPAPVGVGQSLTLSWTTASGVFTDALTETKVVGVPNTSLTMIATGDISGPAGFDPAPSEVTFFFGQRNGGYSMSGTITTDLTAAVPEPSTWALALAGFAGLVAMGWRRGGRARRPAW